MGFSRIPPTDATFSSPGVLAATQQQGLRLAGASRFGTLYWHFIEGFSLLFPGAPRYNDVLWLEETSLVYAARSGIGLVRVDWERWIPALVNGDDDHNRFIVQRQLEGLDDETDLWALRHVGNHLVALEGLAPGLTTGEWVARVLALNADPALDLEPVTEIGLGQGNYVTVAALQDAPSLWAFGISDESGGQILLYEMSNPGTPVLLGALPIESSAPDETDFINVTPEGIFVANTRGITPYEIRVGNGEPPNG